MQSRGVRILALAYAILWTSKPLLVLACSCTGPIPFPEAMGNSRATFVGEVVDVRFKASFAYRAHIRVRELWAQITGSRDSGLAEWYSSPLYGRVATIRLIEGFKGASASSIKVHMGPSPDYSPVVMRMSVGG